MSLACLRFFQMPLPVSVACLRPTKSRVVGVCVRDVSLICASYFFDFLWFGSNGLHIKVIWTLLDPHLDPEFNLEPSRPKFCYDSKKFWVLVVNGCYSQ